MLSLIGSPWIQLGSSLPYGEDESPGQPQLSVRREGGRETESRADGLTTSLSCHSSLSVDWDSHVIKKAAGAEGVT